jgi:uroporphyrin-III C-methyltransferase/precorrin-2 dehydrogenase/sirohydrochlorin ferrochelatase
LRAGGALDVLEHNSHARVEEWLADGTVPPSAVAETITLTSADPEDLTLRQARWLGEADRLVIEGDVPATILARARADAQRLWASEAGGAAATGTTAAPGDDLPAGLTLVLRWQPEARD